MTSEFQQIIAAEGKDGWKTLWEKEITPWNIGAPAPPLRELMEQYQLLAGKSELRALVPGCGQGFDVTYLASLPQIAYACGADLSPLAIQQAKSLAEKQSAGKNFEFLQMDFFAWSPELPFDLVVDYTFLCAIDPSLRDQWSQQMSKLIKSSGILVTLMYPLSDHADGPPFALSVAEYHRLLDESFELIKGPYRSPVAVERRSDREMVAVWKRK